MYIVGKYSHAKKFIMDIAVVAQNRHKLLYLEPGNYCKCGTSCWTNQTEKFHEDMTVLSEIILLVLAKNPFYTRDTR